MLDDIKKSYLTKANTLPGWQHLTPNELADRFIDTQDENLKSAYFAALVCRYWFTLRVLINKNKGSDIPVEECYSWLIESLLRVLGEKWGQRWRMPSSNLYKDPNAVDKSIKRCLASVRAGYYQDANRVKRKANYITDSLEQYCGEFGDYYFNLLEMPEPQIKENDACKLLVQEFFDKGQFLEGMIVDEICYQDCFRDGKLNKRKLVKDLKDPNTQYQEYLQQVYSLPASLVTKECAELPNFSSTRLYRSIDRVLQSLRKDPQVVDSLCY